MKKISILYLEDDNLDVELIRETLNRGHIKYSLFHVQNKNDFKIALKTMKYDLILADFSLPDIDGYGILYLVKDINPDIPTIILSGTINEEVAIDTLKYGAVDYIFKSKLEKLLPSIEAALRKGEEWKRKRKYENELLISESKFRTIFHNLPETVFIIDPNNSIIIEANEQVGESFGYHRNELIGKKMDLILGDNKRTFPEAETLERLYLLDKGDGEFKFKDKSGNIKQYRYILKIIPWEDAKVWLLIITVS
ncbi:MAG: response regulator [Candidatus Delongbacteria bacterium]|nr:response regulator [Candidatus Delongbacteria bacterium]